MSLLSPGVEIIEIDASTIVPTVSNSIGVFSGNFVQGPVGAYKFITSVDELISFYGKPTDTNYNDWYQAYNFLQYGNKLYVARASNVNGTATDSGLVVTADEALAQTDIEMADTGDLAVGDYVVFGDADGAITTSVYQITSVTADVSITLDRGLENAITVADNDVVYTWEQTMTAMFEAVDTDAVGEAVTDNYEYVENLVVISNPDEFEQLEQSIAFTNTADSKLKIFAKTPGDWGNDIEVAIATPDAFDAATPSLAFEGVGLDELFEYAPTGTEVGVLVKYNDEIVETFVVDFNETAKDHNNKSTYIETVINAQSNYIYVKENTANTGTIKSYIYENDGSAGTVIKLVLGADSAPVDADLLTAYELFENKEYLDIDIVIANEQDGGSSVKALVEAREDCIGFIGANYSDVVGKKASDAVSNLVSWRKTGSLNYNNMFLVACSNYKYQYDYRVVA